MDRLEAMRVFIRVVERSSFTETAHDLNIPRSTVTQAVQQLERQLGTLLLLRTTRRVRPTLDGEAYYHRCIAILDDIEDTENSFRSTQPKGLLRVEVQGTIARHFLIPGLPDFMRDYPELEIALSESDRWINVIREGVDCVLRYGTLPDSDLIARQVTMLERLTVAAPTYIERYGMPSTPDDLVHHRAVGIRYVSSGALTPFLFTKNGEQRHVTIPTPVSVTGTESFRDCVLLGLGIAQMPSFHIARDLAEGRLIHILSDYRAPSEPVSILYPRNRQLSPRVRLFIDWIIGRFAKS